MIINKKTSFIETYFDNKEGEELKKTITPNWDKKTLDRHLKLINVPKDAKTIVEIGSGCGRLLKEITTRNNCNCWGFDASSSMISESIKYLNGTNAIVYKCDGTGNIPLVDNHFDFAFSLITFQHIPNTETVKKYIYEMVRVTKPGGEIMFQILVENMNKGHLWSYHNLGELLTHLYNLGINDINIKIVEKWGIIRCRV
jgi:ubiquinone/menaquinone biosynthesis C-methylase UbiE